MGKGEDPYAVRTLLGWGIIGPVGPPLDNAREGHEVSTCNRNLSREVGNSGVSNLSFVLESQTKEKIGPLVLQRMFEQDFSERAANHQGLSSEDRRFLSIAEEGVRHLPDGHFELPLPLKKTAIQLPNNRELAVHRLSHLKQRFMSDLQFPQDYVTFVDNVIKQGYAEKVTDNKDNVTYSSTEKGKKHDAPTSASQVHNVWYVPHHGVYHPKKPNKIRVVF